MNQTNQINQKTKQTSGDSPLVSVVIATLNRPALLDRCLGSLFAQTLPVEQYQVIVVDDGPHSATEEVVRRRARQRPGFNLHYLASVNAHGPAAARNIGWRSARSPLIAFTDDDCIPDPKWLASGLGALSRPDVGAVWGRIVVPLPPEPTDWQRNVAGLERAPCATANCFYLRAVLDTVGGFDERFTEAWREDSDLQFRALSHGVTMRHEPFAVVEHPVRPAPWGISIRLQRQNRFNALLYKKHPRLYRIWNPHEPPWAYYMTVLLILVGSVAMMSGVTIVAALALLIWFLLAGEFCSRRLRGTSHRLMHITEMIVTSLIIPPFAIFWRLYGAVKYRVAFL
jgi:glycosyltransferase involved in cell wall biosynthesis